MGRFYGLLRKTYPFVKPHLIQVVGSALCLIFGSACFLLLPYLVKILIDDILVHKLWTQLYWFGLAFFGLVVLGNLFSFATRYLFANFSEKITIEARRHLFSQLIHYKLAFFQQHQLGDLVSRIWDDSSYIHSLFTFIITFLISNIFDLLFVTIVLLTMNPWLCLLVLATVPLYIVINNHFAKRLRRLAEASRKEQSFLMTFIYDIFNKILLIKNFGQEQAQTNQLMKICSNLRVLSVKVEVSGYMASSITQLSTQIVSVLILFLGGVFVLKGNFTAGSLIAFYTYLGNLFSPILSLTQSNMQLSQAMVCIERYFEYLDHPPVYEELQIGESIPKLTGEIEFDHVTFCYGENPVLENVDLHISPAEKIAIVGRSGIGKTTLALLVKRFFDPDEGTIRLDGLDVRRFQLGELRQVVGYLTQDPLIINGTLRENLLLGSKQDVDEDQIWRVLEIVSLRDFVCELTGQLETRLENNGARLSGGQKQRLSIARVLLQNPPIMIFDEAFSHLDVETEQHIWNHLKTWLADKTTIFITHTLWDPEYFDRLVLLNRSIQVTGHYREVRDTPFLQQILENKTKIS